MRGKGQSLLFVLAVIGAAFTIALILPRFFPLVDSFGIHLTQVLENKDEGIKGNGKTSSGGLMDSSRKNLAGSVVLFSGTIRRGDTLYQLLKKAGISSRKSHLISKSLKSVFNPKNCKPGGKLELQRSTKNNLIILKYFPGGLNYYLVEEVKPDVFSVNIKELPRKKILVGAKGTIYSSLYEAMKDEGISTELIMNFAEIFSWEIDFLTDPRREDTFQLIWERYVDPEGKTMMEGRILAAQYVNKGREYTAIFYTDPEGNRDYYTPQGRSLRKNFLRSPLNYRRISSYFSYRRFHPILKIYRPHLGIDYAAPTGTPVSSVAEGEVIFAGWRGGLGRCVKIKHPGGFITSYGHLSRIARGIRRGKRVSQGQVIGYVGATGLATGPHLDFRISKNGRYLNFLRLKLPRAASVKSVYLEEFNKTKDFYVHHLQLLSQTSRNILVFSPQSPDEKEVALNFSSKFTHLSPSYLLPLNKAKYLI